MPETSEQVKNLEAEERIRHTVEIIASAEWCRFTGFEKAISDKGPIDLHAAAAIFFDKTKPEGQQEIRVPMKQLTEAYDRITSGDCDLDNSVYIFKVGGQKTTIDAKRVFVLTNNVYAWKLEPLKRVIEMMKAQGK